MSKKLFFIIAPVLILLFGATVFRLGLPAKFMELTGLGRRIQGPISLEYWGLSENFDLSAIMFEDFKSIYPDASIKYDQKSYKSLSEYKEFILSRFAENTAADIVLVHATWIPEIIKYLVPSGNITADELSNSFFKTASDTCVTGGSVFCVPPLYDGLTLVYNKDAFNRESIKSPPKTWEEFKQDAERLTKRDLSGKIYFAGAAMGLSTNISFAPDILGLMLAQSSVKIPENLDEKAAADALSFYTSFYTTSKVWDETEQDSIKEFSQGKVAMIFAPSWTLLDIITRSPLLNFGTAPVPQVPVEGSNGLTDKNWSSYWVFVVSRNSANPKVAWDFIKFATSREQELNQYKAQEKYRPFGQIYSLNELREDISKNEILKPYIDGSETATTHLIADQSGNDPFSNSIKSAITRVAKGGSAGSAMAEVKSQIESLLAPKK